MMKTPALIAAACAFASFAAPLTAEEVTAETVVATVNGVEITAGEVVVLRRQLDQRYDQLPPAQLLEGIVNQLVTQELLANTIETDPKSLTYLLNVTRRSNLASLAIDNAIARAVTEEAVEEAYAAQYSEADLGVEYNAAHILLESQEDAVAVIEELNGGADFAETAKAKSTGPSGPNGGDLGWFRQGMMVPPFEAAVVAMEAGAISAAPVQTQFGWHVIKLNETRPIDAPALEQVRSELEQGIQAAAYEAYVNDLRETAVVEITATGDLDPAFLNDEGLLAD